MSLAKKFCDHEVESIYSAANSAIWFSHNYACQNASKKPREEDFVATMVTDAVPILAERWGKLLAKKGMSLRISGVFCHGHPQVKFDHPPRKVELADLLVVHQHIGKNKIFTRAILIQAKMSLKATLRLSSSDSQLKLFESWPKFEFITGGLKGGLRDFGNNQRGSRYALILPQKSYPEQINWSDQCPWSASTAKTVLEGSQSFAKVLGNLLLHKDGRSVSLDHPRGDWSKTVKELLEITGNRTYRRKNIGREDTARGALSKSILKNSLFTSDTATFFQKSSKTRFNEASILEHAFKKLNDDLGGGDIPPNIEGSYDENDPGGISSLIIESSDLDEKND